MPHRSWLLVVAASFLVASCGSTDATESPTQPTQLSSALSVGVSTASPIATAQRVRSPICPSVNPLDVPVVVIVEPPGGASVLVTAIRVQFVDSSGVAARQVTLPAPVPMTQFGSDLERSRSAFPLTIGIGCGTQSTGSLVILVEARDSLGRTVMGRTTVSVR